MAHGGTLDSDDLNTGKFKEVAYDSQGDMVQMLR